MDAPRKTELSERIREELKQLKEDSHSANFDLNKSVTLNVEVQDCGNPITSKIVDWKIQTDLTRVKTIQYNTVGH